MVQYKRSRREKGKGRKDTAVGILSYQSGLSTSSWLAARVDCRAQEFAKLRLGNELIPSNMAMERGNVSSEEDNFYKMLFPHLGDFENM